MKHALVLILFVVCLIIVEGCKQNMVDQPKINGDIGNQPIITGGILKIKKIDNANILKSRSIVSLGNMTIDSTISNQFLLSNIGDYPIRNISMTTTAEGIALGVNDFSINPISIDEISPANTSNFGYIVTVYLNHGLVYGKIGTYNLLSGLTKLSINIAGSTTLDGINFTSPVSLDTEINTSINVADWKLQVSDDGVIWNDAIGGNKNNVQYQWFNPIDGLQNPSAVASYYRIVNIGNVPIGIMEGLETTSQNAYAISSNFTNIPVGSSCNITRHDSGAGWFFYGITTYGTMYNYSKNHIVPGLASIFWSYSALQEGYLPNSN